MTDAPLPGPDEVLRFWFEETAPAQWWRRSDAFDAEIARRFGGLHARAVADGGLPAWRGSPRGRLAEVIVLDQFSRNLHRDDARAFAADDLALSLAREAVAQGADQALAARERPFLSLPFMHSESLAVHDEAAALWAQPGLEGNLDAERRHRAILERFGRYPHRNAALGRASTAEEVAFLATPGSSF